MLLFIWIAKFGLLSLYQCCLILVAMPRVNLALLNGIAQYCGWQTLKRNRYLKLLFALSDILEILRNNFHKLKTYKLY